MHVCPTDGDHIECGVAVLAHDAVERSGLGLSYPPAPLAVVPWCCRAGAGRGLGQHVAACLSEMRHGHVDDGADTIEDGTTLEDRSWGTCVSIIRQRHKYIRGTYSIVSI